MADHHKSEVLLTILLKATLLAHFISCQYFFSHAVFAIPIKGRGIPEWLFNFQHFFLNILCDRCLILVLGWGIAFSWDYQISEAPKPHKVCLCSLCHYTSVMTIESPGLFIHLDKINIMVFGTILIH